MVDMPKGIRVETKFNSLEISHDIYNVQNIQQKEYKF